MGLGGLTKAEQTQALIIDAALVMAQAGGLEDLTIGTVAAQAGLSKSGVFSRVGSREALQVGALKEYERRFAEQVLVPALREPRGLPRLKALWRNWVEWEKSGTGRRGCLFISAAVEYDDRPGPIRDAVVAGLGELRKQLTRMVRQAMDEGHLSGDDDPEQVAFELYGIVLAMHNETRLFHDGRGHVRADAAFQRLLAGLTPR